jgi:ubiquitin-small subunit ribosomal protein S27Ae
MAMAEKKKKTRQLWKLYEVKGDKLIRKNRFSPKSPGDFLAEHKDRRTCGKTGYMEKKV